MSQMPTGRPECKSASWNDPASVRGHSIRDIAYQHVAPMTPAPMGLNAARRFTPMIGGMVSSTVLTLIVIPAIYAQIKMRAVRRQAKADERIMPKLKPAE